MWTVAILVLFSPLVDEDFRDRLRVQFADSVFDRSTDADEFHQQLTNLSFQEASQSEYVGGLVVNRPPSDGGLNLQRFDYEVRDTRAKLKFVSADGKQWEIDVAAEIVLRATKVAIDGGSVLFTATGDEYWTHPSLAKHRLARQMAVMDLFVLRYDGLFDAHSAVVLENEWTVEPDHLGAKRDQPVFRLYLRRQSQDGTLQLIPDASRSVERDIARGLTVPDESVAKNYYDFIVIHRLVRSAANGAIEGFPEEKWERMIGELIARQESSANLIDESPRESFDHAASYHQTYPVEQDMSRFFDQHLKLR